MPTTELLNETLVAAEAAVKARYGAKLAKLSRRFDADDLYQTVCIKAMTGLDRCRAETAEEVRRWVMTIAANSYKTAIERNMGAAKRSVRAEQVAVAVATDQSRDGYQPEGKLADALTAAQVKADCARALAVVDRLPRQQQAAVRMFFIEGAKYESISATLNVSIQAARTLVSRGLAAAKAEMTQYNLPGFE